MKRNGVIALSLSKPGDKILYPRQRHYSLQRVNFDSRAIIHSWCIHNSSSAIVTVQLRHKELWDITALPKKEKKRLADTLCLSPVRWPIKSSHLWQLFSSYWPLSSVNVTGGVLNEHWQGPQDCLRFVLSSSYSQLKGNGTQDMDG